MNKELIKIMEAGPDIDSLIDKFIFDKEPEFACFCENEDEFGDELCYMDEGQDPADCLYGTELANRGCGKEDCDFWLRREPPDYSNDLNLAWALAEKYQMWVYPAHIAGTNISGGWNACRGGNPFDYPVGNGETAALAICRAALLMCLEAREGTKCEYPQG